MKLKWGSVEFTMNRPLVRIIDDLAHGGKVRELSLVRGIGRKAACPEFAPVEEVSAVALEA
jgi:hypothetical protein